MVIMDIFIILRGEDKSMSKKGRNLVLNRKDYERIRRMDYCQMTLWVESVYKSGFKDGKAAASKGALTIDQVREILIGVNGFGEKRVSAVCSELEKAMNTTVEQTAG